MPTKQNSNAKPLEYPKFTSREQEAAWYEANKDRMMEDLFRYGKMVPARIIEKTQQLTMRIPTADIERARELAQKQGVGYQAVLKKAIREGLQKAG